MKISKLQQKLEFPSLRGSIDLLAYPCVGEIKYDGEATYIMYENGAIATTNKYGTSRTHWHKLNEIRDRLEAHGFKKAMLIAELYYGDGKNGALYKLLCNKDNDELNLKIFDIVSYDGKDIRQTPLCERKAILHQLFFNTEFDICPMILHNREGLNQAFSDICADGYEGMVVKNIQSPLTLGTCSWVKLKHKDRSVFVVANVDPTQERMEVIVDSPYGTTLCGVKLCNKYKKSLNAGDKVVIEYQGVLDSGSLRHPVFVKKGE